MDTLVKNRANICFSFWRLQKCDNRSCKFEHKPLSLNEPHESVHDYFTYLTKMNAWDEAHEIYTTILIKGHVSMRRLCIINIMDGLLQNGLIPDAFQYIPELQRLEITCSQLINKLLLNCHVLPANLVHLRLLLIEHVTFKAIELDKLSNREILENLSNLEDLSFWNYIVQVVKYDNYNPTALTLNRVIESLKIDKSHTPWVARLFLKMTWNEAKEVDRENLQNLQIFVEKFDIFHKRKLDKFLDCISGNVSMQTLVNKNKKKKGGKPSDKNKRPHSLTRRSNGRNQVNENANSSIESMPEAKKRRSVEMLGGEEIRWREFLKAQPINEASTDQLIAHIFSIQLQIPVAEQFENFVKFLEARLRIESTNSTIQEMVWLPYLGTSLMTRSHGCQNYTQAFTILKLMRDKKITFQVPKNLSRADLTYTITDICLKIGNERVAVEFLDNPINSVPLGELKQIKTHTGDAVMAFILKHAAQQFYMDDY